MSTHPRDFFIFDLETGGLEPRTSAILSIGAIVLDGITYEEKVRYYTLVKDKPEKIITADALKINGISMEDIEKNGVPIEEALNAVRVLMNGNIVVAQNAAFDAAFLNQRGFNIENAMDTMLEARRRWPGASAKLGNICERMGIKVENAHNAIADAEMTGMVLKEFKDTIREEKIIFRK